MEPTRARLVALVTTAIVPLSLVLALIVEEGRRW
jgi:hypothetical protein